jgi:hypothetical protein
MSCTPDNQFRNRLYASPAAAAHSAEIEMAVCGLRRGFADALGLPVGSGIRLPTYVPLHTFG